MHVHRPKGKKNYSTTVTTAVITWHALLLLSTQDVKIYNKEFSKLLTFMNQPLPRVHTQWTIKSIWSKFIHLLPD